MSQAAEQSNVVCYPTKRKRPYPQPSKWWSKPLPENVAPIRALVKRPSPFTKSPELALILSVIIALPPNVQLRVARTLNEKAARHPEDDTLAMAAHAMRQVL